MISRPLRALDLFCGRLGWSKAFLARGWEVTAVDLVEPPEIPEGVEFVRMNVLAMCFNRQPIPHLNVFGSVPNPFWEWCLPDFICASPPCEEFSVHGMKHFHPNPKYPELGIKLFNHTRSICEESGVPYVMENVRAAQQFIGKAVHHCGPFYLWGSGVPPILPQGITKNTKWGKPREWRQLYHPRYLAPGEPKKIREPYGMTGTRRAWSGSKERAELTAQVATIPPELANCVAEYAERIKEVSRD